ncbi:MAG: phosphotransferase [Candidatus Babeliales bacterium]
MKTNNFLFPRPTGKYAVGIVDYYFKDENRLEIHSENATDKRELMIQIWYPSSLKATTWQVPSQTDLSEKEISTMPYDSQPTAEMLNIERNIPFEQLEDLKKIRTYAQPDALPENEKKYPVILFSPRFVCPRTANTANCEELASHGYIVVGIDPTYSSAMVKFPDGRVVKHKDIKILEQDVDDIEQQVWVDDARFILDQIEKLNSDKNSILSKMFDLEKIGIFGHSYGGSTAAQLCRIDERCKAGVSLDGGLFGKDPIKGFDKPFMFILAENWPWHDMSKEDLKKSGVSQEQYEDVKKKWLEYIPALCKAITKDTYQFKIKNSKHNDFSDLALIKEIAPLNTFNLDTGTINGVEVIKIVNEYLVNFFDKYLKNQNKKFGNKSGEKIKKLFENHIQGKILEIKHFSGGLSFGEKFLCITKEKSYVAKIFKEASEFSKFEIQQSVCAAQLGVAPKIYFHNDNMMVMEFVPGNTLSIEQAKTTEVLNAIVGFLKSIKNIDSNNKVKDVFGVIIQNLDALDKEEKLKPFLKNVKDKVLNLKQLIDAQQRSFAFCHGDLNPRNIFFNDQKLTVIDWASCGMYYQFYDIAYFSVFNCLDNSSDMFLLTNYLQKQPNIDEIRYFKLLKSLVRIFDASFLLNYLQAQNYVFSGNLPEHDFCYYENLWAKDSIANTLDFNYSLAISELKEFFKEYDNAMLHL